MVPHERYRVPACPFSPTARVGRSSASRDLKVVGVRDVVLSRVQGREGTVWRSERQDSGAPTSPLEGSHGLSKKKNGEEEPCTLMEDEERDRHRCLQPHRVPQEVSDRESEETTLPRPLACQALFW